MPQMVFEDFVPQVIWLVFAFTFLYVVMSRVALPRIAGVIEERRDKIADDLDRAAEFKKEAEQALAAYKEALADARNRALAIAAKNREEVKAETEKLRADSDAKIADMMHDAERRIEQTKEAALVNVRDVAADVASAVVEKLLGQSVGKETVDAVVDAQLRRSQS